MRAYRIEAVTTQGWCVALLRFDTPDVVLETGFLRAFVRVYELALDARNVLLLLGRCESDGFVTTLLSELKQRRVATTVYFLEDGGLRVLLTQTGFLSSIAEEAHDLCSFAKEHDLVSAVAMLLAQ
ncbi:MAG: hypothetical protein HYZ53_01825 [Planctomycetes bacterium]|nr:hypothetical protein [Planctomycetota bacterium]